jgi:hypothetical protein
MARAGMGKVEQGAFRLFSQGFDELPYFCIWFMADNGLYATAAVRLHHCVIGCVEGSFLSAPHSRLFCITGAVTSVQTACCAGRNLLRRLS